MAALRKPVSLLIPIVMAITLVALSAPASAHGRMPLGKYDLKLNCAKGQGCQHATSDETITLLTKHRYRLRVDTATIGGHYRHIADSKWITFTSGPLKDQPFKWTHTVKNGRARVIQWTTDFKGSSIWVHA